MATIRTKNLTSLRYTKGEQPQFDEYLIRVGSMKTQVATTWVAACDQYDEYLEYGNPEIIGINYDKKLTPIG